MLDQCSEASRLILAGSVLLASVVLVLAARTVQILALATKRLRERTEADAKAILQLRGGEGPTSRDREQSARDPP